jgi:thiamine biosynthesis lipoprotein
VTTPDGSVTSPRMFAGRTVSVETGPAEVSAAFRAMACDVTMRVVGPTVAAAAALERARDVFVRVERSCTRFDPSSPLMRANADPDRWHVVPRELYEAVAAAAEAHLRTGGLFDPRVLRVLESLGYDHTLPFAKGDIRTDATPDVGRPAVGAWLPGLGDDGRSVRLGPSPVDLGGIGKGLAVRWAAAQLRGAGQAFLVEAGGDCAAGGAGPDGDGWRVAVEDPAGGADPVAVLALADLACATSSTRVRRWHAGGRPVHHLIDPRLGQPGATGLVAVTVVGPDPAWAEVWSKTLFLVGAARVEAEASHRSLAALWVADDGTVGTSPALDPFILWRSRDVG